MVLWNQAVGWATPFHDESHVLAKHHRSCFAVLCDAPTNTYVSRKLCEPRVTPAAEELLAIVLLSFSQHAHREAARVAAMS